MVTGQNGAHGLPVAHHVDKVYIGDQDSAIILPRKLEDSRVSEKKFKIKDAMGIAVKVMILYGI